MFSSLFLVLGVVSLAQAAQFNVTVGGGPLRYDPQFVVRLVTVNFCIRYSSM
jgi:hypothetical protein